MATAKGAVPRPPVALLIATATAALVAAGSTGPWAHVPALYEDTVIIIDGTGMIDGVFTFALGITAAALVLWRMARLGFSNVLLAAAALLFLVIGFYGTVAWVIVGEITNLTPGTYFPGEVEAAWGLMMVTFAGWAGLASSAYQLWYDELR